jgi:hypothetical protein
MIQISDKIKFYSNEELELVVKDKRVTAKLKNLGTHPDQKVIGVQVYLNGIAQAPGKENDYCLGFSTGVIVFNHYESFTPLYPELRNFVNDAKEEVKSFDKKYLNSFFSGMFKKSKKRELESDEDYIKRTNRVLVHYFTQDE